MVQLQEGTEGHLNLDSAGLLDCLMDQLQFKPSKHELQENAVRSRASWRLLVWTFGGNSAETVQPQHAYHVHCGAGENAT